MTQNATFLALPKGSLLKIPEVSVETPASP
jgi:hypothetical protein